MSKIEAGCLAVIINSGDSANIGKTVFVIEFCVAEENLVDTWHVLGEGLYGVGSIDDEATCGDNLYIPEHCLLRIDDHQEDKADEREKSHESA